MSKTMKVPVRWERGESGSLWLYTQTSDGEKIRIAVVQRIEGGWHWVTWPLFSARGRYGTEEKQTLAKAAAERALNIEEE